ncbi:hypothetical protein KFL_004070090 [Klebsormidium nitens]|uniref:Uncharacterized protein n=1 Tax=Klebsormidium nitens TaxID=105231 RepID=A0A1Y1IHR0_KLENI|nr:hypothetical protein KFL_004070090 [Klebsormidium nitens]|eukprot:GAQ88187.1 hypothetical protein KFL_004070090 [Klebsormidium nitens]
MGRGQMSGGGSSQLNYLFGGGEEPVAPYTKGGRGRVREQAEVTAKPGTQTSAPLAHQEPNLIAANESHNSLSFSEYKKPEQLGRNNNNYVRVEGQNTGNFITDRPTSKVLAAPGGGSSLGYLFGN